MHRFWGDSGSTLIQAFLEKSSDMSESVKKLIRAPLKALGLDVVKHRPRYSLGEYAFLCTLGIRTVIDAGAHEGEFAQMIMKILPEVSVISCEPLQEPYRHLETSLGGVVGLPVFQRGSWRYERHSRNASQRLHAKLVFARHGRSPQASLPRNSPRDQRNCGCPATG